MKKIGLFLLLLLALAAQAQQADSTPADAPTPQGTVFTNASFPMERVQTPTSADLYCAGFVSKQLVPNANFVAGGLQTLFGGQISIYVDLCEKTREEAFQYMMQHASERGANAIINMRYDANEVMNGVTEVLAYGTAVMVEKI